MVVPPVRVLIDFNNDGTVVESDALCRGLCVSGVGLMEDVTGRVLRRTPLTFSRGRDQLRAFSPPMAGSANGELNNVSRDYSTLNTSSVLTGNLKAKRPITIEGIASTGLVYNLWKGRLDGLPQHPEKARRSVEIPATGNLSRLRGQRISTALYSSYRTDQAMAIILAACGITEYTLDTGLTTMSWWWLDNEDAFDAAIALMFTEGPGANIYEDGTGRILFKNRHHRLLDSASVTVQATFRDTGSEPLMEDFVYDSGAKAILNAVTAEVKTRSAKASGVVWSLGSTITLGPGEARDYVAKATDPFTAAITPASGTDYTVTAGSLSSLTLNRTSGASCTITLTAGASGATVTGLQLRAQTVSVDQTTPVHNTISAAQSVSDFGAVSAVATSPPDTSVVPDATVLRLPIRAEVPLNDVQDFCNAMLSWYQGERPTLRFRVTPKAHTTRELNAFARDIGDRIAIHEAQTGLAGEEFWIEFKGAEMGDTLRMIFGGEQVPDGQNYWTLGVAGASELGVTTVLAY